MRLLAATCAVRTQEASLSLLLPIEFDEAIPVPVSVVDGKQLGSSAPGLDGQRQRRRAQQAADAQDGARAVVALAQPRVVHPQLIEAQHADDVDMEEWMPYTLARVRDGLGRNRESMTWTKRREGGIGGARSSNHTSSTQSLQRESRVGA